MAGTIVTDRIESDASYASSITVASPMVVSNTLTMGSAAAISGNVNIDNGTLFVDSVGNKVGIGTTTPSLSLNVKAPSGEYRAAIFETESLNGPSVQIKGSKTYELRSTNSGAGEGAGLFFIYDKDNEQRRLQIDASGRVTMPGQPSLAVSNPDHTTGNYTGGTVFFDTTSSYNSDNGRFTAPVTGKYLVGITVYTFESSMCEVGIYKNGAVWAWLFQKNYTGGSYEGFNGSQIVSLTAGDYINWYNNKGRTRPSTDDHRWVAFLG